MAAKYSLGEGACPCLVGLGRLVLRTLYLIVADIGGFEKVVKIGGFRG